MNRRAEIFSLHEERRHLSSEIAKIDHKLDALHLEQSREDHPCPCVVLNQDIDIFSMVQIIQSKRELFSVGSELVGGCLSALKSCPICHGTGVPAPTESGSNNVL
jgi:hypothetical protein